MGGPKLELGNQKKSGAKDERSRSFYAGVRSGPRVWVQWPPHPALSPKGARGKKNLALLGSRGGRAFFLLPEADAIRGARPKGAGAPSGGVPLVPKL